MGFHEQGLNILGRRDGRATGQPLRPRPEGLREPWGRVKDSVPRGARSVWRHPPNPAGPLLLSLVAGWPTARVRGATRPLSLPGRGRWGGSALGLMNRAAASRPCDFPGSQGLGGFPFPLRSPRSGPGGRGEEAGGEGAQAEVEAGGLGPLPTPHAGPPALLRRRAPSSERSPGTPSGASP